MKVLRFVALVLTSYLASLGAWASNLATEFSIVNNPNGPWAYGYASTPGGTFTKFTTVANPADGLGGHVGLVGWTVGNVPAIAINTRAATIFDGNVDLPTGEVVLHGRGSTPQAAEVTWTAAVAGNYSIDAKFTGRQVNVTANVSIFDDSSSLFSESFTGDGTTVSFLSVVALNAGDVLTFAVNRNGSNGFFSGNWVGLALTIDPIPEPATLALFLFGVVPLLMLHRKSFASWQRSGARPETDGGAA